MTRRIPPPFQQTILALAATTTTVSHAFSSSSAFVTATRARRTLLFATKNNFIRKARPTSTATPTMFFGNLFRDLNSGFVEDVIDYSTLNHPGPELSKFAEENQVITTSKQQLSQDDDDNDDSASVVVLDVATFAGGCFWGLELAYQRCPGVVYTTVGYTQGREEYPTYSRVCAEATGHTEAVCVYYNPNECTYDDLLNVFFSRVNPLTVNGQGKDYGKQYRTGVYYHTAKQEAIARARFQAEQEKYTKKPIATELRAAMPFWPAERYHQQYLSVRGSNRVAQSAEKGCTDTIRCYG